MIILRRDREGGGQKSESLDKKNAQIFFWHDPHDRARAHSLSNLGTIQMDFFSSWFLFHRKDDLRWDLRDRDRHIFFHPGYELDHQKITLILIRFFLLLTILWFKSALSFLREECSSSSSIYTKNGTLIFG